MTVEEGKAASQVAKVPQPQQPGFDEKPDHHEWVIWTDFDAWQSLGESAAAVWPRRG
jgi:hypothetical protein